jgi:sulfur-oxidizing protein SoxY
MFAWCARRNDGAAMMMNRPHRREVLQRGAALALLASCGWLPSRAALAAAAGEAAFEATSIDDALRALGGIPVGDAGISLDVPELVENGAVVPVSVTSRIAGTQEISIVVELNPYPLIARFVIPEGTEPYVFTRVKMAQSGSVLAVVRAEGRLYSAFKNTKVMVGGCGA